MALFDYEAFDLRGREKKGVISAESLELASEKLAALSLLPIKVKAAKGEKKLILTLEEKLVFTQEMHELLLAHLPLYEALCALEEKASATPRLAHFLSDLCDQVRQGLSFTLALKASGAPFDPLYFALCEAGEKVSRLATSFGLLAAVLKKNRDFRQKLISAFTYPLLLLIAACALFIFILLSLLPSLEELFEGRRVHGVTAFLFSLSRALRESPESLLFIPAALALLVLFFRFLPRQWVEQKIFSVPLIGFFKVERILAQFARALGTLLESHIPLVEAVNLSARGLSSPFFKKQMENVALRLGEGLSFSAALALVPHLPPLFLRLIRTGEKTGELAAMALHLAALYEERTERNLATLSTALQPIALVLIAAVVGLVVLAVILPLTDVGALMD